jgi:hypothetical protein
MINRAFPSAASRRTLIASSKEAECTMMTEDQIDRAYYRLLNGWRAMSSQGRKASLIELRVLQAESKVRGKGCHEEMQALSHLEKRIMRSLMK